MYKSIYIHFLKFSDGYYQDSNWNGFINLGQQAIINIHP